MILAHPQITRDLALLAQLLEVAVQLIFKVALLALLPLQLALQVIDLACVPCLHDLLLLGRIG